MFGGATAPPRGGFPLALRPGQSFPALSAVFGSRIRFLLAVRTEHQPFNSVDLFRLFVLFMYFLPLFRCQTVVKEVILDFLRVLYSFFLESVQNVNNLLQFRMVEGVSFRGHVFDFPQIRRKFRNAVSSGWPGCGFRRRFCPL